MIEEKDKVEVIEIRFGNIQMSIPKTKEDMETAARLLMLAAEYVFEPDKMSQGLKPPFPYVPKTKPKRTVTKKDIPKKRPSYVNIMENFRIEVDKDDDIIRLIYLPNNTKLTFTYSFVRRVFDALPDRFTANDLYDKIVEIDPSVEVTRQECTWLMRVFTYVDFDAEVKREGNKIVAIKMHENGSLREENVKKLEIEKDLVR